MFSSILLGAALFGSGVAADKAKAIAPATNGILQTPIPGFAQSFSEGDEFPTNSDGSCQSGLYIAKEIPTHLYEVDQEATFTKLHDCEGVHAGYNAIGYNVADNFIYGVARGEHADGNGGDTEDAHMVIRINKNGCTEDVVQLPPNSGHVTGRHISADIHLGFLWAGRGDTFRQVNLTPVDGKHAWIEYTFAEQCTNMNDFAFAGSEWASDPSNTGVAYGDAFGWDVQAGQFCQFKAAFAEASGTQEHFIGDFGLKALLGVSSLKIGAFFMDKDGSVYMYENDLNTLYKITGFAEAINTSSNVEVAWAKIISEQGGDPEDNNVDGASCADAPGEFGCLSIDKRCCDFDV